MSKGRRERAADTLLALVTRRDVSTWHALSSRITAARAYAISSAGIIGTADRAVATFAAICEAEADGDKRSPRFWPLPTSDNVCECFSPTNMVRFFQGMPEIDMKQQRRRIRIFGTFCSRCISNFVSRWWARLLKSRGNLGARFCGNWSPESRDRTFSPRVASLLVTCGRNGASGNESTCKSRSKLD